MRKAIMMMAAVLVSAPLALAQNAHSPETQAYLSGEGMGLAKAAELNHYPGPKHVLDAAETLQLSSDQIARATAIYDRMHQEAVALGELIIEKEGVLNGLFADRKIDKAQLESLVSDIAKLQGKLRVTHLTAHLQMKEVLSPEQIAKYEALQGYGPNKGHDSPHHP